MSVAKDEITCLDDVPEVARIAARQEFLNRYYKPVAMIPFIVVMFVELRFFPNSTGPIPIAFVFASLGWVLVVLGYAVYLRFSLRCPVCGWRGLRDKCSSCDLPRHRPQISSPSITDIDAPS
jgi:hypothetical protein